MAKTMVEPGTAARPPRAGPEGSSDSRSGEQAIVARQSNGTCPDHLLATEFWRDRAVNR
jgi:hypothetical protein